MKEKILTILNKWSDPSSDLPYGQGREIISDHFESIANEIESQINVVESNNIEPYFITVIKVLLLFGFVLVPVGTILWFWINGAWKLSVGGALCIIVFGMYLIEYDKLKGSVGNK